LLKIDGQDYWLWIAYDEPNLNTCLMMHLSRERTIFVCYQFLRQLRNRYGTRKPIYTDGARWYDDACKWLRLKYQIYDTGLKNLMEKICTTDRKDRTECFDDDHFPCRKKNCNSPSMFGIG
jgi:putative transposase